MKKIVLFLIMFFVMFGLTSCKEEGVSLFEAVGFKIEDIESARCNTSMLQSYMWEFEKRNFKYLDVQYEITNSSTNDYKMNASLIVYVETKNGEMTTFYFFDDYIYLVNNEANTNYVSIKKTNIDYSKVSPK